MDRKEEEEEYRERDNKREGDRKREREWEREIDRAILWYRENVCFKQNELSRVVSSQTINYKTS